MNLDLVLDSEVLDLILDPQEGGIGINVDLVLHYSLHLWTFPLLSQGTTDQRVLRQLLWQWCLRIWLYYQQLSPSEEEEEGNPHRGLQLRHL